MDARYILLIQKQFDQPLSERETYELQGFLAGNEAAAKLCENVRRMLAECENLDLPEDLKPVDAEYLLTEIIAALTQSESRSWFSFVKQFVKSKKEKPQGRVADQDDLAVLRKHKASAERSSRALDAVRAKVMAEVAPVTPQDAVSLAEAIKRRMLSVQQESEGSTKFQTFSPPGTPDPWTAPTQTTADTPDPWTAPTQIPAGTTDPWTASSQMPPEPSNPWDAPSTTPHIVAPLSMQSNLDNTPTPSIAESMDQLFSSANWPVITPEAVAKSLEQDDFKAPSRPAPIAAILKNRFQQQQQQQQQQPTTEHQPTEQHREQDPPGAVAAHPRFEPPSSPAIKQNQWSEFDPINAQPAFASEQMEPIWQLEPQTQLPDWQQNEVQVPIWELEPIPPSPVPPAIEPERIRPASLIPVDDIIAHVSQMFSEHIPEEAPKAVSPGDTSLAVSGSYPQIRELDLRKATAARLSATNKFDESNGQIKALGKFLLDQHSEAAIGNLSSANANLSHARILSDEEAQALQDCLSPIESLQGVAGCIILGYDGMIIMNSLPEHADKDALSAWALLTYMNTHELVCVVGHSRLRQFVSRTTSGYLLLADFGQGLLLAVSDNASTDAILPLMKSVRRVTAA